jgi:hypothetical protein
MSCYDVITMQLYEHRRCLNGYVCINGLRNYLNASILSNDHLVCQEVQPKSDL